MSKFSKIFKANQNKPIRITFPSGIVKDYANAFQVAKVLSIPVTSVMGFCLHAKPNPKLNNIKFEWRDTQ